MPPLPVIFKTVSTDCNLDCSYCYYRDAPDGARARRRIGDDLLERFMPAYMDYVSDVRLASLVWQGGEPTLAGLAFFEKVQELELRSAHPGTCVSNSLQTNGVLIDDAWARFLARNRWLVGVSLDGPAEMHDEARRNRGGRGTFDQVMAGIAALHRHDVEINVLCVLGPHNVEHPRELMRFYRAHGFTHVQFIPAMDFQAFEPERAPAYLITPEQYGDFLVRAFDLWYEDGAPTLSVRTFDNFLQSYVGTPNDLCVHSSRCDAGIVVEWDGSVYPCDFYVHPTWKLGNVMDTSLREIAERPARRTFAARKQPLPDECTSCEWLRVCNGGCPRNWSYDAGAGQPDRFCPSYRRLFAHADGRMTQLASALGNKARYLQAQRMAPREVLTTGRNDPCPCGSGRKHKHCCGSAIREASYVFRG